MVFMVLTDQYQTEMFINNTCFKETCQDTIWVWININDNIYEWIMTSFPINTLKTQHSFCYHWIIMAFQWADFLEHKTTYQTYFKSLDGWGLFFHVFCCCCSCWSCWVKNKSKISWPLSENVWKWNVQAIGKQAQPGLKGSRLSVSCYWTPLTGCQATAAIEIPPTPANIVLDYNLQGGCASLFTQTSHWGSSHNTSEKQNKNAKKIVLEKLFHAFTDSKSLSQCTEEWNKFRVV